MHSRSLCSAAVWRLSVDSYAAEADMNPCTEFKDRPGFGFQFDLPVRALLSCAPRPPPCVAAPACLSIYHSCSTLHTRPSTVCLQRRPPQYQSCLRMCGAGSQLRPGLLSSTVRRHCHACERSASGKSLRGAPAAGLTFLHWCAVLWCSTGGGAWESAGSPQGYAHCACLDSTCLLSLTCVRRTMSPRPPTRTCIR